MMNFKSSLSSSCFFMSLCMFLSAPVHAAKSWPSYGGDLENSHNAKFTGNIRPNTVEKQGFRIEWGNLSNPGGLASISAPALASVEKRNGQLILYELIVASNQFFPLPEPPFFSVTANVGDLRAIDVKTGNTIYSVPLSTYSDILNASRGLNLHFEGGRMTPTIHNDYLIITHRNQKTLSNMAAYNFQKDTGLWVLAVNKFTGAFDPDNGIGWATKIEGHPNAAGTASPVIDKSTNTLYIGYGGDDYTNVDFWSMVNSFFLGFPPLQNNERYHCCNMRGAIVALNANTGQINWKTYTVPPRPGEEQLVNLNANHPTQSPTLRQVDLTSISGPDTWYAGATSWSSQPVIDKKRGLLYVGTGNNSSVAPEARLCELKRQNLITPSELNDLNSKLTSLSAQMGKAVTCDGNNSSIALNDAFNPNVVNVNGFPERSYGNNPDAILALDLETGALRWSYRNQEYDSFNNSCDIGYIFYVGDQFGFNLGLTDIVLNGGVLQFPYQNTPAERCPYPQPRIVGSAQSGDRDADFAQSPKLARVDGRDVLVNASKGGDVIAVNPDNGSRLWKRKVSGGGFIGGFEWGSAIDDENIYVIEPMINNNPLFAGYPATTDDWSFGALFGTPHLNVHQVCKLVDNPNLIDIHSLTASLAPPFASGNLTRQESVANDSSDDDCIIPKNADGSPGITTTRAQFVSAIRLKDGKLIWQYADPSGRALQPGETEDDIFRSHKNGGLTLAKGVLFDSTEYGVIRMHEAKTGKILRELDLRGTGYEQAINGAPTIVGNRVFYGTGTHNAQDFPTPFTAVCKDGVNCADNMRMISLKLCKGGMTVSASDPTTCIKFSDVNEDEVYDD